MGPGARIRVVAVRRCSPARLQRVLQALGEGGRDGGTVGLPVGGLPVLDAGRPRRDPPGIAPPRGDAVAGRPRTAPGRVVGRRTGPRGGRAGARERGAAGRALGAQPGGPAREWRARWRRSAPGAASQRAPGARPRCAAAPWRRGPRYRAGRAAAPGLRARSSRTQGGTSHRSRLQRATVVLGDGCPVLGAPGDERARPGREPDPFRVPGAPSRTGKLGARCAPAALVEVVEVLAARGPGRALPGRRQSLAALVASVALVALSESSSRSSWSEVVRAGGSVRVSGGSSPRDAVTSYR